MTISEGTSTIALKDCKKKTINDKPISISLQLSKRGLIKSK